MWQDARVKHVGRRDEDLGRRFANLPTLAVGRVSIVDCDANLRRRGTEPLDVALEPTALIPFECFEGKEIEGAALGVGE
jgi:hypothetical protein